MVDSATTPSEVSPEPPKRRRWLRRLAILAGVLLLLAILAPLSLSLPFVRKMVADKIGAALGREVTIGGAFAFWGRGLDLDDLVVQSPAGFDEPLATVKHVHVDVSVLALLGGGFDADVLVEQPRVAFAKDAAGRSNTDGLFGAEPTADRAPDAPRERPPAGKPVEGTAGADVRLNLRIVDGVVRATLPSADRTEELKDLDVVVALEKDGALALRLSAQAVGAATGGGDAPLDVDIALSGERAGPVKIEIPSIDLARLAGIVEGASGIRGLRGIFRLSADAQVQGADRLTGRFLAQADGLALRTPDGLRLAAQMIRATADVAEGDAGTTGKVEVRMEHTELLDERGETPRRFHEPLVELVLEGRHDAAEGLIVVQSGRLAAGEALTASASKPWEIRTGETPSARGELVVQADLGRLANLHAFVPALESIRAGRIGARVVAEAQDGLDVKAGIRVLGLDVAPGALSPNGHVERDILLQLQVLKDAGHAPTRIVLAAFTSSIAKWAGAAGQRPLEIQISDAGLGAQGGGTLDVDLAALGTAFGGALGLERGERLGGTLRIVPEAALEPDAGVVKLAVTGRNLTVPPSWAAGVPPASLDGLATLTLAGDRLELDLSTLRGFGLDARATASVNRAAETGGLERAALKLAGDLAQARPLLAPLLGLEGRASVAGRLDAQVDLVEQGGTRRLTGRTSVTGLVLSDTQGRRVLEEPRLELTHDVSMSTGEDGRYAFKELKLVSQALQARLDGAAVSGADGADLDATLHLDGDANRLAGLLRSAFGEEYEDLKGSGRIQGQLGLRGGTAQGMRTLLVDGSLKPGGWSAGGLTLANAGLTVKRAAEQDPLRLVFQGGVNGGRMELGFGVRLGTGPSSWTLDLRMERVDTSPLLVDHGAGEYLTWFLPTLVPSDKQGPVLSGLLDAKIAMRAADLGDRLESTLVGDGVIKMDKGSIGESTLFRVVSGGSGLGNVGNLLVKAVPEVGSALAGLQRSMTFTTMESVFDVANRVVNVRKGLLDGERTRIGFKGTVGFNEAVNLDVNLTFLGTAGKRLKSVLASETIPLKVTGKMDQPRVQPGIDASKLAAGALDGLLPGDGKNPLDRLKDLIPR